MTFQITEILDSQSENILTKALHQNNRVTATLFGVKGQEIAIGKTFQAEIGFGEILRLRQMIVWRSL
jgi:hypothetical protein